MTKILNENKGVILFLLAVCVLFNFWTSEVKRLDNLALEQSQVSSYEK